MYDVRLQKTQKRAACRKASIIYQGLFFEYASHLDIFIHSDADTIPRINLRYDPSGGGNAGVGCTCHDHKSKMVPTQTVEVSKIDAFFANKTRCKKERAVSACSEMRFDKQCADFLDISTGNKITREY